MRVWIGLCVVTFIGRVRANEVRVLTKEWGSVEETDLDGIHRVPDPGILDLDYFEVNGTLANHKRSSDTFSIEALHAEDIAVLETDREAVLGEAGEMLLPQDHASTGNASLVRDVDTGSSLRGTQSTETEEEADLESFDPPSWSPRVRRRRSLQTLPLSTPCPYFRTIKVAIAYDGDFCGHYGTREAALNRIVAIVSSASAHYENDMCIKLKLTDMIALDTSCGGELDVSGSFHREKACANGPSLLPDFADWMHLHRRELGVDDVTVVHLFTGAKHTGAIGCAYQGTLCWRDYSYGVEYITFNSNLMVQATVFAHELGHSLNAVHIRDDGKQFIMENALNNAQDGFSDASIDRIMSFLSALDDECTGIESAPQATNGPTVSPTSKSSMTPSSKPSMSPSSGPSPSPSAQPTSKPIEGPASSPTSAPVNVGSQPQPVASPGFAIGWNRLFFPRFGFGFG